MINIIRGTNKMLVGGCVRRETRFREIKGFVGGGGRRCYFSSVLKKMG